MSEKYTGLEVVDTDHYFVIDAFTREITSKNPQKDMLIQNDHNSERFTFEIPRFIEGRDVGKCNVVQVCYLNGKSSGVYTVDDLNVYPFVNDILTCSWLVSQNATSKVGPLRFMLRFAQVNDDASLEYAWSTKIYEKVRVVESLDSAEDFEREYVDVIEQWKNTVMDELSMWVETTVANQVDVAQITTNQQKIQELNTEAATLEARMNAFTKLVEGSTTGDAELIDARITVDGKTWANAGTAIREQFKLDRMRSAYGSVYTNGTPTVEFVTEDHVTLTIPKNTHVFFNGKRYDITDVTATYTMAGTTYPAVILFNILFDPDTKTFSIEPSSNTMKYPLIRVGWIYRDVPHFNDWMCTEGSNFNPLDTKPSHVMTYTNKTPYAVVQSGVMTLTIPSQLFYYYDRNCYIVEPRVITYGLSGSQVILNILHNHNTDETILRSHGQRVPPGYVVLGVVDRYTCVMLFGHSHKNHDNRTPAALIMGAGGSYVEFDSVNKTVTFPNDTLVLHNGTAHYIQLATAKGNNSISYADFASSALAVYLDVITEQLAIVKYNDTAPDNYLLLCSFRTNSGGVSINAPYSWNGKPFKLDGKALGITEVADVDLKSNFMVKSVNHRGYNVAAPENTLSAFKLSAQNRFDYVECDVSFTSDNVPVVLHDATIDRTSNGTGYISQMTFAEVREYDFGSWYSEDFAGEKIPSFEEFIALCKKLGLHPYIEIKSSAAYTQEQISILVDIVKRYGMKGNVTYISFDAKYLGYVKNVDPNARLGYVMDDVTEAAITTALGLQTGTNEVVIDAGFGRLTTETVQLCIDADLPLEVWTVNSASNINNMHTYISGVTSDSVHAGRTLYSANV